MMLVQILLILLVAALFCINNKLRRIADTLDREHGAVPLVDLVDKQ